MLDEIAIAAAIVSACLMTHLVGILLMADWLFQWRETLDRSPTRKAVALMIVSLFGGILLLHLIQTGLWAVFYHTQNLFDDFETSLYFSMVSFTTLGYGDVLLPKGGGCSVVSKVFPERPSSSQSLTESFRRNYGNVRIKAEAC